MVNKYLVAGIILAVVVCYVSLEEFDEILIGEESHKNFNLVVDNVGVDAILPDKYKRRVTNVS